MTVNRVWQLSPRRMIVLALLLAAVAPARVHAQSGPRHRLFSGTMPPGMIGRLQTLRQGLAGYCQPVAIHLPRGARVSLPGDGAFEPPEEGPALVGMQIGHVYRFKVTDIPRYEGLEVFPSIEVIDRLHPPEGKQLRFPIPVTIDEDELELALNGSFVIRVIYLEDPDNALPIREKPGAQRVFDVRADQDPLHVADELGRPMAILRIGSRVPDTDAVTGQFLFDTPPLIRYPHVEGVPPDELHQETIPAPLSAARHTPDVPRVPLDSPRRQPSLTQKRMNQQPPTTARQPATRPAATRQPAARSPGIPGTLTPAIPRTR